MYGFIVANQYEIFIWHEIARRSTITLLAIALQDITLQRDLTDAGIDRRAGESHKKTDCLLSRYRISNVNKL